MSLSAKASLLAAVALATSSLFIGTPAHAASGNIDHVETSEDSLRVVYSLSGMPDGAVPDLDSVTASFDGVTLPATAEPIADADQAVRRTAVLALDVSNSMRREGKFEGAKEAALAYLDNVPGDVSVGLVTFARDVRVAQPPTEDIDQVRAAIDGLTLSRGTRLYDGLIRATELAGTEGARSILVLSDGRNTGPTPITRATDAVSAAGVQVDVVALGQDDADAALLEQLADAGEGSVIAADDAAALEEVFASEALALAQQILVTVTPDESALGEEGSLEISFDVDGTSVGDRAYITMPASAAIPATAEVLQPSDSGGWVVPRGVMIIGLVLATLAVIFLVVVAMGGVASGRKEDALDRSIEAYTRQGARRLAEAQAAGPQTVTQQAVAVAQGMIGSQKGLEAALGARLEAAGLSVKPAEWVLIHAGVAIGFGIFGALLGGGNFLALLLALVLGAVVPWLYLAFAQRRRLSAFRAQLADTLQLMAGSLSAGLSLLQSVDTVVREGSEPISSEFRRAVVESRLGVEIDEALTGVALRMKSVDFEWVVMAIRIQREVGGNLSELLNKVADTIREREYLERQVKTLSAEGRLSVWILGALPPGFMAYLGVANPGYLAPMFTHPFGWAMLIIMAILLVVGIFWMTRLVKVDV